MRYRNLYKDQKTGIVTEYEPRIGLTCELVPDRGARILDVGCNDGMVSQYLKKEGNAVSGIEINEELAAVARERIKEVLVQDIEERWQVGDGTFDVIHLGAVLEHVFDYDFIFKEACRVLKDGGSLVISVPNFGYIFHRIDLLLGRLPRWYQNRKHIRAWTKSWLSKNLRQNGFKPVKWYGTMSVSFPLVTALSKYFPSLASILICKAVKEGK